MSCDPFDLNPSKIVACSDYWGSRCTLNLSKIILEIKAGRWSENSFPVWGSFPRSPQNGKIIERFQAFLALLSLLYLFILFDWYLQARILRLQAGEDYCYWWMLLLRTCSLFSGWWRKIWLRRLFSLLGMMAEDLTSESVIAWSCHRRSMLCL